VDGARDPLPAQAGLPAFQQAVARFVAAHALEAPPAIRLLDLVSEAGEVAKELLAGTRYGREEFRPGAAWAEELADLYFALVCVANSTGVNLEAALEAALAKYDARLAERGDAGSGR
jgi:NTP pyrophosphatase (non-canonical NTP hydrolase)